MKIIFIILLILSLPVMAEEDLCLNVAKRFGERLTEATPFLYNWDKIESNDIELKKAASCVLMYPEEANLHLFNTTSYPTYIQPLCLGKDFYDTCQDGGVNKNWKLENITVERLVNKTLPFLKNKNIKSQISLSIEELEYLSFMVSVLSGYVYTGGIFTKGAHIFDLVHSDEEFPKKLYTFPIRVLEHLRSYEASRRKDMLKEDVPIHHINYMTRMEARLFLSSLVCHIYCVPGKNLDEDFLKEVILGETISFLSSHLRARFQPNVIKILDASIQQDVK